MPARRRGVARSLAPEIVQTSAMDCGPAALKCLLDGFGLHASYGRLREACQTDVDGTSIDTLEDLANAVGLIAEQILVPVEHLVVSASSLLPAIVVVRQPGGLLHFVVAWRRHGPVVQIMDPATGRRWPRAQAFTDQVFVHTMPVPAAAWRSWADSDLFHGGLAARARRSGIGRDAVNSIVQQASRDPGWKGYAALDAALRMTHALRTAGGFSRREAERTLRTVWERTCATTSPLEIIPADYWTVSVGPGGGDEEQVLVRGAVLVRVSGVRDREERQRREADLSPEVTAALHEPPFAPGRHLLSLLRADGTLAPATLLLALLFAAAGVVGEALLFRSLIDLGPHLTLTGQRLATIGALVCLSALLLALELPIAAAIVRLGRRLETRLRIAFLEKIPKLVDRYFQSRPSSDMAQRAHAAHQIRELPNLGAQLARATFELALTTLGIALLYPESAGVALSAALTAIAIPSLAQPWLSERDLRQRTHSGALTRFYLDAFLGLVPVRAHGAERTLAREQESLLVEWARAGRAVLRAAVATSALQLIAGFGFAAWLLFSRVRLGDEGGGVLLLAYWALNIPVLGQEIAQVAWQYPVQRNLTLRLLEPLGALEDDAASTGERPRELHEPQVGVSLQFHDVQVRAGGHTILQDATLSISAGTHVAIVGASGAGKSTFVGLLLGWHKPSHGQVIVDGEPLDARRLDALRRATVWVDPAVQLWNRSLLENLEFGNIGSAGISIATRAAAADLRPVIEQLPEGLQTPLGEGGALVSGGEGQRVRFGRGLGRSNARLVVLDEPFRGLERDRRSTLLRRARAYWPHATLVCVTHDIAETAAFDRVIVIADGRVVEDGAPAALSARTESTYRALLDAEAGVRIRLWADPSWRTVRLEHGRISAAEAAGIDRVPGAGEDDYPREEPLRI